MTGIDNPDSGWRTVPQNTVRGELWELVPDDTIDGRKFCRQRLVDERITPQAFTVRVGDFWSASMTSKDWMQIKIGDDIRDNLPPVIKTIVPYRLAARIFFGLSTNTDGYICLIEHESFHAYQGIVSADRLASAETVLPRFGRKYPWSDSDFNSAWKAELDALADALSASQEQRSDSAYKPVQALSGDPDFKSYSSFTGKWAEELITLRRQSKGDEIRFYYSGMAQAFLLDRLNPDWKARILKDDVFLEDLLYEVLTIRGNRLWRSNADPLRH